MNVREKMSYWLVSSAKPFTTINGVDVYHDYKDWKPLSYWFRFDPAVSPEDDLTGAFDFREAPNYDEWLNKNPEPIYDFSSLTLKNIDKWRDKSKGWKIAALKNYLENTP